MSKDEYFEELDLIYKEFIENDDGTERAYGDFSDKVTWLASRYYKLN